MLTRFIDPGDIFTLLMIIGGDVVQVAIAQVSGGPVTIFTPVVFSFGWVTYAVQAMLSAVGENRLMPKPEVDCAVINAHNGYRRTNSSWVLSRILRDFEHWQGPLPDEIEAQKLKELQEDAVSKRKDASQIRIGLRVTIWQCVEAGKPRGDLIYWAGFMVAAIQLGIAAIPWGLYGEWLIFLIVGVGTLLAFFAGSLPQWHKEKFGVRTVEEQKKKDIFLKRGNGDHDALLILGHDGCIDLEALASPYRDLKAHTLTRPLSLLLAALWILLLLLIAGYDQHTWYMMAAGILGILHNVAVAGLPRSPKAMGIDLQYVDTIVDRKVMGVLWRLEKEYPKAGRALIQEFFPGDLWPREQALFKYAERRIEAFKEAKKAYAKAKEQGLKADAPRYWQNMPLLERPEGMEDDSDIPTSGEYQSAGGSLKDHKSGQGQAVVAGASPDHLV